MKKNGILFGAILLAATAAATDNTVWQLGVEDGGSKEFLPFSNAEFKDNPAIGKNPAFDAGTGTFTFRIGENKLHEKPEMPAGVAGENTGNNTIVRQQELIWNEPEGGWRELELRVIPAGHRVFPARDNSLAGSGVHFDRDDGGVPKSFLKITLPGKHVFKEYLPYRLEAYLAHRPPMVLKMCFRAERGENRIVLREDSGFTYGRCYHFDYLKLRELSAPYLNSPVIEAEPGTGFLHQTVYESKATAVLKIGASNLAPQTEYLLKIGFIDYFDRTVKQETHKLIPDADGRASVSVECPRNLNGHFRVAATLFRDGKEIKLPGNERVLTRLAAVRMIAPLSAQEIEESFIGLCGLSSSQSFDPYLFRLKEEARIPQYRAFRRILQIRNERFHSLPWNWLEKEEGKLRWEFWDELLKVEKAEGIRIQLTIAGTPEWLFRKMHPGKETSHIWQRIYAVPEWKEWERICNTVAQRYRDRIAEIEIWNEPSEHSIFWQKGSAADYFELVKRGAEAIRKVAPELNIVAETVWARQQDFSDTLYRLGIGRYVDHPADHYLNDMRLKNINIFLDRVGRGKGLINNEEKADSSGSAGQVNDDEARRAARNLMRNYLYQNANRVKRIYNYLLIGNTWRMWGCIGPDLTPKFSFSAFKTLTNRFAGSRFLQMPEAGATVECYLYEYLSPVRVKENGSDNIMLLANRSGKKQTETLFVNRPEVVLVDLMDNSRNVRTENGMLKLDLNDDPVMILGADKDAIMLNSALRTAVEERNDGSDRTLLLKTELDKAVKNGRAELVADISAFGGEKAIRISVASDELKSPVIRLRKDLPDGRYRIKLAGTIRSEQLEIPVERQIDLLLTAASGDGDLIAVNSATERSGFWAWDKETAVRFATLPNGAPLCRVTAAPERSTPLRTRQPLQVIPGERYFFSVRARGKGLLRVLFAERNAKGDLVRQNANYLNLTLDENEFRELSGEWVAPEDTATLQINLYQWNTEGHFEFSECRFLRLPEELPAMRRIHSVAAVRSAGPVAVDGNLSDWRGIPFREISGMRMENCRGPEDIAAEFAVQWKDDTIFIAVKVRDDRHTETKDQHRGYEADSVQVSFDVENRRTASETAQFTFSSADGKPAVFRHQTITTPDIVSGYKVGPDPEGVLSAVKREGNLTGYEMAIPARAIVPTFHFVPGQLIGFSILVNDNDGNGRKGYLEWSGGIGDGTGSLRFGGMVFR